MFFLSAEKLAARTGCFFLIENYDEISARNLADMKIHSVAQLGQAIRTRRKALKLTQVEAAGMCGVGERFLRELERGKPTVETGRVLQVLAGLGIDVEVKMRADV